MSGADGRRSAQGYAGWDWRLVLARVLLAIACIPVALIFYEAWIFNVESADLELVGYRVFAYSLAAVCLLTGAGIAFAFRRWTPDLHRSKDGARRPVRMKASEALIIAAVFVAGSLATVLYYSKANNIAYVRGLGKVVATVPQRAVEYQRSIPIHPSGRSNSGSRALMRPWCSQVIEFDCSLKAGQLWIHRLVPRKGDNY